MRVSNRMMFGNAAYNMMRSEEIIQRRSQEIGTGKRIGIPSDDPFGTSRAMIYRTNLTEIAQYTDNSNRAGGWLNLTDNSLVSVVDNLQRVRELVIAGANDTNTPESWNAMAEEIDKIRDGIMEIANTTIDNRYIFAGEKVLEKAYEMRNPVYSDKLDLKTTPLTIALGVNDQFDIVLDGAPPVTITLPDATTYTSLDDLADEIQTQLNTVFPFAVPIHVKATPDNKLAFYAGTQPPDNIQHTLVLRQTLPANTGLAAIGFQDGATTKEIIGIPLTFPVMAAAKYPVANSVTGFGGGNAINLNPADIAAAGYYDNWTLMTDDGTNVTTQPVTVSGAGTVSFATALPASANLKYYLSPPLTGQVAAGTATTITLTNGSTVDGFYVGMPITITDGAGKNQTSTITDYTGGVVTVNPPFAPPPDPATSRYAIDADYYINANNKFKITVGNELPQEISLDGADYSPAAFAQMLQTKIQERGGPYANIQVSITADNRLRITPQDAANNPLTIKLESGSTADGLWLLGFKNGAISNEMLPNYEGNKGTMNYEINVGIKMSINAVGDTIFDPIFEHLNKISIDLRAGNISELSNADLRNVKQDLQQVALKQSEIGAKTNRIEKGIERLQVMDEYFNKFLGQTEDTDITKAITELTMQQTSYQAALQVAAKTLTMTLLDFLR
jgi:flagellin-like hook-associated protein FlgL